MACHDERTWDELDDHGLRSDRWTLRNAVQRVGHVRDRFAPLQRIEQDLPGL